MWSQTNENLLDQIHEIFQKSSQEERPSSLKTCFDLFLEAMESGEIRAAIKVNDKWQTDPRVKEGILLGFRLGKLTPVGKEKVTSELDTYAPKAWDSAAKGIRIVPGGSSVRRGSYLAPGVIMMPPAFVNVGGYVDEGTMIDSHALVGSCAQVGKNVHLSAGVQLGGVLEPVGQTPVIIEDGAMIGGNVGIFEGVQVGARAVVAAGCQITASTPIYDIVHNKIYRSTAEQPLRVPEDAVVVMGTRKVSGEFATTHGLQLPAAMIIKYRDPSTDSKTLMEALLR